MGGDIFSEWTIFDILGGLFDRGLIYINSVYIEVIV